MQETNIINGRKMRDAILADLKLEVAELSFQPCFVDVLVGSDGPSAQYVGMKNRIAESIGIKTVHAAYPENISTDDLILEIEKLSKLPHMCGLIVQLPLPASIDTKKVLDAIPPHIDVDATGEENSLLFYEGKYRFLFPTAAAIIEILDSTGVALNGKKIVVIGQGKLVGTPVTFLLKSRGLHVETVVKETINKDEIIKNADVIITAVGKAKLIMGEMIKKGVIIIDAGTSESKGGIAGDVDFETVNCIAGYLSPVPGGVGPMTVAVLMKNVVLSAKRIT